MTLSAVVWWVAGVLAVVTLAALMLGPIGALDGVRGAVRRRPVAVVPTARRVPVQVPVPVRELVGPADRAPYRWRYLDGAGGDVTQRLIYDGVWVGEAHVVHALSGQVLVKLVRRGGAWGIGGGHLCRTLGVHGREFYALDEALAFVGERGRLTFVEVPD